MLYPTEISFDYSGKVTVYYGVDIDEKIACNQEQVMQFTGLHDKNGKEIYEGDVLLSKETDEVWRVDEILPLHRHDRVTNIGYFSGKKYHLRENPAGQHDNYDDWMSWPEMYEIIGNIYEHGHLLK